MNGVKIIGDKNKFNFGVCISYVISHNVNDLIKISLNKGEKIKKK